jgi:hypothetical protein
MCTFVIRMEAKYLTEHNLHTKEQVKCSITDTLTLDHEMLSLLDVRLQRLEHMITKLCDEHDKKRRKTDSSPYPFGEATSFNTDDYLINRAEIEGNDVYSVAYIRTGNRR